MATLEEQMKQVQDKMEGLQDKITRVEALPEGLEREQLTELNKQLTELNKQLTELNKQLTLLQEKEILLLKERAAAQQQAAPAETIYHLIIDGKEVLDSLPFKPNADLLGMAAKFNIDIQGYVVAASATTEPQYQPVTNTWSPAVEPAQAVWIKGKTRKGSFALVRISRAIGGIMVVMTLYHPVLHETHKVVGWVQGALWQRLLRDSAAWVWGWQHNRKQYSTASPVPQGWQPVASGWVCDGPE